MLCDKHVWALARNLRITSDRRFALLIASNNTKSDSAKGTDGRSMGCHPAKKVPSAWNIRTCGLIVRESSTTSRHVQASSVDDTKRQASEDCANREATNGDRHSALSAVSNDVG